VGESRFLRWWPLLAVVVAVALVFSGSSGPLPLVLMVGAVLSALMLPWRFVVVDDGIALWFPFGRRRFYRRDALTVRADRGGAVAYPGRARRFGYPLTDGLVEKRRLLLRAVLVEHGFRVI
jgi:hypothetical protein